MRIIPLFPLNIVLFPGMVLPLRIFEPRYRLMIRRCLDGDKQFGIALIQEGDEVGAAATPFATGTLAEISGFELMPDGQIMLVCVGLRRFRIERHVEGEPYAQAEVEILDEGDPEEDIDDALIDSATTTLEAYLGALANVSNLSITVPKDGLSAIDLSYLMAATLQVDNAQKQELLESPTVHDRLERVMVMLTRENEELQAYLAKSRTRGDFFYRGYRMSVN
ncbi:MAG: peptidase [Cyanobacteria bacterium RYN_339]|nr:peptidase [Cyanobacteria bacterium RYN_339]